MKKIQIYLTVILTILLSGCFTSYKDQVVSIKGVNLNEIDRSWVFENDKVIITYDFWAKHGNMSFEIYNKLDLPIYIDWKNSSFIYNGTKNDYWVDQTNSSSKSSYSGVSTRISNNFYTSNNPTFQSGSVQSITSSVKLERVSFLPPKSKLKFSQFKLANDQSYFTLKSPNIVKEKSILYDRRLALKYEIPYSNSNTVINFRNYLAFTMTENSKEYFYIDNEFYVSKIIEMNDIEFDLNAQYNKMNFYINNIPIKHSIKYEKYTPIK